MVIANLHSCGTLVDATFGEVFKFPLSPPPLPLTLTPPLPLLGAPPPTGRLPATRLASEAGRIGPM